MYTYLQENLCASARTLVGALNLTVQTSISAVLSGTSLTLSLILNDPERPPIVCCLSRSSSSFSRVPFSPQTRIPPFIASITSPASIQTARRALRPCHPPSRPSPHRSPTWSHMAPSHGPFAVASSLAHRTAVIGHPVFPLQRQ